jgi:hypothetical protein
MWPPALGDTQHFFFAGHLCKTVRVPDCAAQSEVTRQQDVWAVEGDYQEAVHRPWTHAWDRGERGFDLLVGASQEGPVAELSVGEVPSERAQRLDLAPRQTCAPDLLGAGVEDLRGLGRCPPNSPCRRSRIARVALTDSCCPTIWNNSAPKASIAGSSAIQPRGSKSGCSSMSRASTGSACRRCARAAARWPFLGSWDIACQYPAGMRCRSSSRPRAVAAPAARAVHNDVSAGNDVFFFGGSVTSLALVGL